MKSEELLRRPEELSNETASKALPIQDIGGVEGGEVRVVAVRAEVILTARFLSVPGGGTPRG